MNAGVFGGGSSALSFGLSLGRYDSPSMTKSCALFLKRSTALCASSMSSNIASHSEVSRFNAESDVMRSSRELASPVRLPARSGAAHYGATGQLRDQLIRRLGMARRMLEEFDEDKTLRF